MMMSAATAKMIIHQPVSGKVRLCAAFPSLASDCSRYQRFSHSRLVQKAEGKMICSGMYSQVCLFVCIVIPGPNLPLFSPTSCANSRVCSASVSLFCFGCFAKSNLFIQEGNHSKMLTGECSH
ncbi:hypothetical protein ILYODFUR_036051 [Ilyodon furcidens]|uniref:Uncharacterized protein n=1 Tax=Ilyodon furcidens TaxID=33524 RepID=A0ABV0VAM6_9TELE